MTMIFSHRSLLELRDQVQAADIGYENVEQIISHLLFLICFKCGFGPGKAFRAKAPTSNCLGESLADQFVVVHYCGPGILESFHNSTFNQSSSADE